MKIGIDISQTVYEGTGVARFTNNFVKSFVNSDKTKDYEFHLFFSTLNHKLPGAIQQILEKNENAHLTHWVIPPRALSYLWGEDKIRNIIPNPINDLDVFISSDWAQPHTKIAKHKITIVHDQIFRKYPETVDPIVLDAQTVRLKHVTNECDLIFCDSKSTQNDLITYYPSTQERTRVNYPGVDPVADNMPSQFQYSFLPKKYFLSVGKLEPRKNIPLLIDAYCEMVSQDKMREYELVIVGPKGWDVSEQHLSRKGVHFLGSVSDPDLNLLYHNALAFVYPTIYEGFGIPPLEAMHSGCPVILSNTSSLTEIADNTSALYIDPNSKEDIKNAMIKIAQEPEYAKNLAKNGFVNVKRFDWSVYTEKVINEIEKLKV